MVEEVVTDELEERLNSGDDVQVVDIREESEVLKSDGFIEGCIHVPMSRLTLELGEHDWKNEIYVICRHGNSSIQAVRLLEAYEGVDEDARVVSVAGGYEDWDGKLMRRKVPLR